MNNLFGNSEQTYAPANDAWERQMANNDVGNVGACWQMMIEEVSRSEIRCDDIIIQYVNLLSHGIKGLFLAKDGLEPSDGGASINKSFPSTARLMHG